MNNQILFIIKAFSFASQKHIFQLRRDEKTPYINHLIEVATIIVEELKIFSKDIITAAILHDTLEDTNTNEKEISNLFGKETLSYVKEVTDDMSVSKIERKKRTIIKAQTFSYAASVIKLSDCISNIRSMIKTPPNWTLERKIYYIEWQKELVKTLPHIKEELKGIFYKEYNKTHKRLTS